MDKNYIVTKSNSIITAKYDLTLQEQKLILTLASTVQPNDEDFKEYEFKIKDFMNLLEVKNKNTYSEIRQITRNLMKKVFEIKEGNDIVQLSWFSSVRYKVGEGTVVLKFDNCLKPYLLQLKELYTSYKLENILTLKSKYSLRLFEILKSNQFKRNCELDLEELKVMLGATEKSYSIYQNVKNRIIIRAQNELKEKTDISFDFEEIKTGRKVTSIRFFIRDNSKQKLNAPREETPLEILEKRITDTQKILKNRVKDSEALSICGSVDGNMDIIQKAYDYCKDKKTDNFVGYIIKIAKSMQDGTFNPPQKIGGKASANGFNNFEGRKYSERYSYLMEQCLNGLATDEEKEEFDKMRGER